MKFVEWVALMLGASLLFAPLVGGIVQNGVQAGGHNCCGYNNPDHTVEIQGWLTILVAALTLVVIGFQAWIYHGQRELMNRQAEIMSGQLELGRDTAIRQLRAYVCVVSAILKFDNDRQPDHVLVVFKNSGQTPAYKVRIWINLWLEIHPLMVELPQAPDSFVTGISIIAPNATTFINSASVAPQKPEIWAIFGTCDCTLYAYGRATYLDAFNKERTTNFRLIYGGPNGAHPKGFMQQDTAGNDAT